LPAAARNAYIPDRRCGIRTNPAAEETASIKKAAPKRERWTRRHKRGKRYAKTG